MRRIVEIELTALLQASEKNSADAYVKFFRDAGLYTTIDENTENEGILLIWKLRDVMDLLFRAEELHKKARNPNIFSISSIAPIVWMYIICLTCGFLIYFGYAVGFWLVWMSLGCSAIIGLCFAFISWIRLQGQRKYTKIRCHSLQKKIHNYIQDLSKINFCTSVAQHSIVIHHPQRKKICKMIQEAQVNQEFKRISELNMMLQDYDRTIQKIIKEHQTGYLSLDFVLEQVLSKEYNVVDGVENTDI